MHTQTPFVYYLRFIKLHTSLYVNLIILRRFYGIICTCTNSVYQAVFSSPAKNGLGMRLGRSILLVIKDLPRLLSWAKDNVKHTRQMQHHNADEP